MPFALSITVLAAEYGNRQHGNGGRSTCYRGFFWTVCILRVHFGAALFRSNLPDSSVRYVGHCKTVRPDIIVHDLGPKMLAAERLGTDLN